MVYPFLHVKWCRFSGVFFCMVEERHNHIALVTEQVRVSWRVRIGAAFSPYCDGPRNYVWLIRQTSG